MDKLSVLTVAVSLVAVITQINCSSARLRRVTRAQVRPSAPLQFVNTGTMCSRNTVINFVQAAQRFLQPVISVLRKTIRAMCENVI